MSLRTRAFQIVGFLTVSAATLTATPLLAQSKPSAKASVADTTTLTGNWTGKATVPLGDSTIVVPVSYTFTLSGSTVGGTAMVPGQGMGQISNVVREGPRVKFRVTVAADAGGGEVRQLEHDGTITAAREMEGMVQYNAKPIASFKISPTKPSK